MAIFILLMIGFETGKKESGKTQKTNIMPRKNTKPPVRLHTRLIDAPEKYTSQDIFIGQVIAVEDMHCVILVIGAQWVNEKGPAGLLMPHQWRAVIAELDKPDLYYNLKLHENEQS
jgi:hypothetical protein